jgi:Tfp pilus assembly major pilin PilA
MYYFIYKTTNILDGSYYIGCHQTSNLNDGYLGSGKHLTRAIKKYGKSNFRLEILNYASSKEEMFKLEKELVTEEVVRDTKSYNLKVGGSGGNLGIVGAFKGKRYSEKTKEKQRIAALKQITSEEKRIKLSTNNWARKNPNAHKAHISSLFEGKPKSENQKRKLSETNKGNKLVNNGKIAKWVKKDQLLLFLKDGWTLGQIPHKH